jgi:hypothetical protein
MPLDNAIRDHVFNRQKKRWASIANPGPIARLFRSVFGQHPTQAIFIAEHETADPDTMWCAAEIVRAWRLDQNGLREVKPSDVDAGETVGRLSQFQITRFHVSDDHQHVFLNEMEGPGQGVLTRLQQQSDRGPGVQLKIVKVRLVLRGRVLE